MRVVFNTKKVELSLLCSKFNITKCPKVMKLTPGAFFLMKLSKFRRCSIIQE